MPDTAYAIPPDAGPAGPRSRHDVISRGLEIALGSRAPTLRARLSWRMDPAVYGLGSEVIAACVRPGDLVLDIGANWGLFTYRLSREVGPGGRVEAFEPGAVPLPSLRAVAAAAGNVTVHEIALSDYDGEAAMQIPVTGGRRKMHAMATLTPPSNRPGTPSATTSPVPVRRLDDVLGRDRGPIAFVKCDVEGHELATLRGAEAILRRDLPPILIEIEQRHQDGPMDAVLDFLRGLGYDGWTLDAPAPKPISQFDVQRDQLAFLKPNALFTAARPGYLHNFLFAAAGTPPEQVGVSTR